MNRQIRLIGLIGFIGLVGYGFGFLHGHRNIVLEDKIKPKLVNLELRKPSEVDFSLFWDAYETIDAKHIKSLDLQKGTYGAISGLLQSLKDPFSAFLDPTSAKLFTQDLKGEFSGIGAELAHQEGKLIVVSPIEGTPADKVGLKPKDEIVKIDGQDVSELSFGESIEKIRGRKGQTVTLTIVRAGVEKPFDIAIVRDVIKIQSVSFKEKDNIGILRISQFSEDTTKTVKDLEDKIKSKKAIVVDLRNNPGGLLNIAIDTISLFDDKSPLVIEEAKDGKRRNLDPTARAIFKDVELVVLINEGSASASEIFAGAIQDHGRGKVVGAKSFGKGSVQNLESLKDGSILRITVASWLTPKSRQINGTGIKPDIEVTQPPQDDSDPQLDKALEILVGS